ncbi:MAG TPA: sugar isomerase domain-containing protein, partial [Pseudonocardiaceae bacterium]
MTDTTYDDGVRAHLTKVADHNASAVADVAELLLACVRADGTVLTAGAGHSLAAVAETFYRAGGLACVRPLYHPDLLPMHGAVSSTKAERRSGLAAEVLGPDPLGEKDVLVVFSTSGVNPYPVELAGLVRAAGRPVVAVTSGPASAVAPRRAGSTLAENATVVLDTLVPPGDATYPTDLPVAAPISTVANAFLWNLVLVRLIDLGNEQGVALPLWRSSN